MIGLVLFAGLIWGLLTHPCEVWAAYLRACDQRRRAREYRPAPPPYEPDHEPEPSEEAQP